MKNLSATLLVGCAQCVAATPSSQVVDACLKTESTHAATYAEIAATNFNVEEDADSHRTATTLKHRGHTLGLWESAMPKDFGLVYNSSNVARTKVIAMVSTNLHHLIHIRRNGAKCDTTGIVTFASHSISRG